MPGLFLALAGIWPLSQAARSSPAGPSHGGSQRGREFTPGQLDIRRGDIVSIVNDDEALSHRAHVMSDRFKFDSGDQEPGHDVDMAFTVAGTLNVLCGIHPKMRSVVTVH